jgi:hypothetical protein
MITAITEREARERWPAAEWLKADKDCGIFYTGYDFLRFVCTRPKGHTGPHAAHNLSHQVMFVWDEKTGEKIGFRMVRRFGPGERPILLSDSKAPKKERQVKRRGRIHTHEQ